MILLTVPKQFCLVLSVNTLLWLHHCITGGEDYTTVDTQLTFQPQPEGQTTMQCVDVPIVDDGILEANETFIAQLRSDNPDIIADTSSDSATVEIINDDSKLKISSQ